MSKEQQKKNVDGKRLVYMDVDRVRIQVTGKKQGRASFPVVVDGVTYQSSVDAAAKLGLPQSSISRAAHRRGRCEGVECRFATLDEALTLPGVERAEHLDIVHRTPKKRTEDTTSSILILTAMGILQDPDVPDGTARDAAWAILRRVLVES